MTKPGDSQTKKTLHELAKEFPDKTCRELEKYRDADRVEEAIGIGHNQPPDEGEEQDNPIKEAQARSSQLQDELDRTKKENNDLHNKVADLTEATKSKDYFEKPDYKFLVNENHRLEQQYLEVMADNKKLAVEIEDRVNQMRKSGL